MPIVKVQLKASASLKVDPVNVNFSTDADSDNQIEFSAEGSDFTIVINSDDNFFTGISGDWVKKLGPGEKVTTPVIKKDYSVTKEYTVKMPNPATSATITPELAAPGKIIVS